MKRSVYRYLTTIMQACLLVTLLSGCGTAPEVVEQAPAQPQNTIVSAAPTLTSQPAAVVTDAAPQPQPTSIASPKDGSPAYNPAVNTALSIFTTADFSGSGICATCHTWLRDASGADVSMPDAWRSTMMANAARDPVWQAKVSSEIARFPALQSVIEKKCTTCHMPMAETQAVTEGKAVTALGDGFFNPGNPLYTAAVEGVSCTLCHQINETNLGTMAGFSGGYSIDTTTNPPFRLIYGPYQQPFARVMQNDTGFTPVYGEHMTSAEHCGTCHNLYTPYVDAQGNILGEFPEQTPYSEWLNSGYSAEAKSCQGCHMPLAQGAVVIANRPGRLQAREPFYQHFFVGGNAFMLNVLKNWGADMAVTADQSHFDTTIGRVNEQISNNTATLALEDFGVQDDSLTARLKIDQLTGHKFPTSFPSRRAWLHVMIRDANGTLVFESGRINEDGSIAGNNADLDAQQVEPHYDLVTSPDQVQIYEPIMGDNENQVTYTLLRGAQYLKDNRLLPAGAVKADLPPDIAVYGEALADTNFIGGGDVITYQVDVSGAPAPFTFTAELLYQTLSYRFVQDLLADDTEQVERFDGYYGEMEKTPLLVASLEQVMDR